MPSIWNTLQSQPLWPSRTVDTCRRPVRCLWYFLEYEHVWRFHRNNYIMCGLFKTCFILKRQSVKGTPLRSGRVTHLKRFYFENLFFLAVGVGRAYQIYFVVPKYSFIDWQLILNLSYICSSRKALVTLFPVQQIYF